MAAKGGAPLAAQPRPASPGRSLGRHGGVPLTVQLSCSRARVGVRARVHGARTHGGARSPRPDYRRGLRIPGSRRILLNSFEKRGIFGPQVRGNTAEISENSESIRSMRIAVLIRHKQSAADRNPSRQPGLAVSESSATRICMQSKLGTAMPPDLRAAPRTACMHAPPARRAAA